MLIGVLFAVLPAMALLANGSGGAVANNILGAFGLEFDVPVAVEVLGASVGHPPYPSLPLNLSQEPVETAPDSPTQWYLFAPKAVPKVLRGTHTRFFVMVDDQRYPVRIVAEAVSEVKADSCTIAFDWLNTNLKRKYLTDYDVVVKPREGFKVSTRYTFKARQVDVACGDSLLIEYTDADGVARWVAEERKRLSAYTLRMKAYAEQEAELERINELLLKEDHEHFADTFTLGDRYRLEGGLGVRFGSPFSPIGDFTPDKPFAVKLDALPPPFAEGSYEITLAPDRTPIRIGGYFPDPNGDHFKTVSDALRAKYGAPMKNGETHKIHKINGNFVIARNNTREGRLDVVFIDNQARKDQKEREIERKHAEWEEETAGL